MRDCERWCSEHQIAERWWLWMPDYEQQALNAKQWTTTLNAKLKQRLWLSNWRHGSERRTEERHDGSKCQTKNEQWLWMSNPRCDSDCQSEDMQIWMPNWNNNSGCQTEDMTLNTELKKDMMALNAKPKMNNGSECQTQNAVLISNLKICGSER